MTSKQRKMNDLTSKTTANRQFDEVRKLINGEPSTFVGQPDGVTARQLPANVLRDVREYLIENRHDVKNNDDADFVIANSTVTELFDAYLMWNGVIGYTEQFIEALDGIRTYVEHKPATITKYRTAKCPRCERVVEVVVSSKGIATYAVHKNAARTAMCSASFESVEVR